MIKTWLDVREEALFDPILQQLVHMAEVNRERALIETVLFLAKLNRESIDREVTRLRSQKFSGQL